VVDRDLVPREWVIGADDDLADAEDRFSVFSIQHKEISGLVAGVGYASANPELQRRIKVMKYLLSGVAIVAALAIVSPASAQDRPAHGGYQGGSGAPASTQNGAVGGYQGGSGAPASTQNGAVGGYQGGSGAPASTQNGAVGGYQGASHARHVSHGKAMKGGTQLTGDMANQLNQEELARLQAGNYSDPPVPPGTMPSAR
jgi:hypothetical protein